MKDRNALLSGEFITQHKLLACDLLIRNLKDANRKFIPKRKIYRNYMKAGSGVFKGTVLG